MKGFFVGYSLQSKAFRVIQFRTPKELKKPAHHLLKNKPNVAGSENQANLHAGQQEANQNAGTEDIINAGDSEQEDESAQDCFVLQNMAFYCHNHS
ncbi:hypothetical protein Tco_1354250 [Tanacetum coccineum]